MAHAYRDDFPLLKSQDVAYLDNAATAQRPQCVLDAVTEFYKSQNANPLRGLYPLSIAATEAYENAREAVRSFLNAKSSREIIFTRNTTESINLVAYSYGLSHVKAGDEVLVSIMEHHSNLLPWQMVCRQTGASLKFMECEMDGTLDLNKVEVLITPKTKIVACTHVSNVLGRVNPIRELAALAHPARAGGVGARAPPPPPTNGGGPPMGPGPARCWSSTARRARRTFRWTCKHWTRISSPSPATRSTAPWASAFSTDVKNC